MLLCLLCLLCFFAFWELARECTSTEESFSPQWFLSLSCAVGCLCDLIINSVQKAIVGYDEHNWGRKISPIKSLLVLEFLRR